MNFSCARLTHKCGVIQKFKVNFHSFLSEVQEKKECKNANDVILMNSECHVRQNSSTVIERNNQSDNKSNLNKILG